MRVRVFLNHFGVRRFAGLLEDDSQGIGFQYDDAFLKTGIPLSPYHLPLRPGIHRDDRHTFDGLFGVFNDSLPDGWGLLLIDRSLSRAGRSLASITPLERLCLAGSRGMGALEYEPDESYGMADSEHDLDALAFESARILGEYDYSGGALDALLRLSGSLAGARPKVMLSIEECGGISSWIVKFPAPGDRPDAGLVEYLVSCAAKRAGVDMPETRLFSSAACAGYFGIRRFDRIGGNKVHTHTACGLLHASHRIPCLDYENLIRLTSDLTKDINEVRKMVGLMVFNVAVGNNDDHSKNFSFLMDGSCRWKMAPAYDITPCRGYGGERRAAVNGKGRDISADDLVKAASVGGIPARDVREMIERSRDALADSSMASLPLSLH